MVVFKFAAGNSIFNLLEFAIRKFKEVYYVFLESNIPCTSTFMKTDDRFIFKSGFTNKEISKMYGSEGFENMDLYENCSESDPEVYDELSEDEYDENELNVKDEKDLKNK